MYTKIILFLVIIVATLSKSQAATYYISVTGDDAQPGTSTATAWRTVDRVNVATFQPGDKVLFAGGETFTGSIWLQAASKGTPTRPIVLSSYGVGRATIFSGTSFGFYGQNTAGIELRNLAFVGSGRLTNANSGVIFNIDSPNTHLEYLRLDSLDVSGYRGTGILVGSWSGSSGFTDVRITTCRSHANGEAGFSSYAENLAAHHNWYVGNCKAYDNAGRADVTTTHTGNGIVLSGIDGALIEHCEAYNNGWLNANQSGGPVGIWGWCCNNLTIQNCESHHNSSGTAHDGGGFDLDGGCTNSIMQYNYSHDNGGPGYLLAQYPGAPVMRGLTIRYNVSQNDARRDSQGALQLWSSGSNGGIQQASIYNNTVLLSPPADGSSPKAVFISSSGVSDISIRNNVLETSGGLVLLNSYTPAGLRFEGNCYWSGASPLAIVWNGTSYGSLAAFRTATGQERLADGRTTGLVADPLVSETTQTFAPVAASPVLGAGLDLLTEFNISRGPHDFIGNPTPQSPARGNIGALEATKAASAPLPVILTFFSVEHYGDGALLRWGTAMEMDNAYFSVESSVDGQAFTSLVRLAGHGNSSQAQQFQYVDPNIGRYAANTVYYRLRQVDTNGKATFSPVRALSGKKKLVSDAISLQVSPNPAQSIAKVVVAGGTGNVVHLLNIQGQHVESALVGVDGLAELRVTGLTAGVYIVQCGNQAVRLLLE